MNKFKEINIDWLRSVAHSNNVELFDGTKKDREINKQKQYLVDFTGYNFVNFFNLLNIFLVTDYIQSCYGRTNLRFTGLGPYAKDPLIPIHDYNAIKSGNKKIYSIINGEYRLEVSDKIYPFIAFLHHFGLFEALIKARDAGNVFLEGIDNDTINNLFHYSGTSSSKSKILKILPIYNSSQLDLFMLRDSINDWLSNQSQEIRESPIFSDGEFAKVLGYQLGLNIIEHSQCNCIGEHGALGAIAMRIISPENYEKLKNTFSRNLQSVFNKKDYPRGVLEICVGDRGVGIVNSLKESYLSLLSKSGKKEDIKGDKIISFAFDELGSRKPPSERFGGVHALHRILRCIVKYNGILRVRSSGFELIYNAGAVDKFERGKNGTGIVPTECKEILPTWGTQLQLLIPLTKGSRRSPSILPRGYSTKPFQKTIKVVPAGAYLDDVSYKNNPIGWKKRQGRLAYELLCEPESKIIAYDFEGRSWKEEKIIDFLLTQKSILHTHDCICVNVDVGIAKQLRDRERLESENWPEWRGEPKDLFEILSTQHRILPLVDTKTETLTFLGLGKYQFDEIFDKLITTENSYSIDNLLSLTKNNNLKLDKEPLLLYLCQNKNLIKEILYNGKTKYKAIYNKTYIGMIISKTISTSFKSITNKYNCIHDKGLYKLPSREGFTDKFFQSINLHQSTIVGDQIADWLTTAIKSILNDKEKDILIVCTTAPVELASLKIANAMIDINVHILNLGYYSSLDKEKLLNNLEWNIPTFIITDVVDTKKSVNEIEKFLDRIKIKARAIIALLRFTDGGEDFSKSMFWDPPPDSKSEKTPCFYVSEMKRPQLVPEEKARAYSDDKLFFVEPFSLELFDYESLSRKNPDVGRHSSMNVENIKLLETGNALRWGHYVYGSHHFFITTSIQKILSDEKTSDPIISKIFNTCKENEIDHILYPLHSNIGRIIPQIKSSIQIHLGKSIDYSFCISTQVLTERPFYLLTDKVKKYIDDYSMKYSSGKIPGLRILILDDAVSSGRTFETIIRALFVKSREAVKKYNLKSSPIDAIFFFTILNRQSIAKNTLLEGVNKLSIAKNDYSGKYSVKFSFDSWLNLDMPVAETSSCKLCQERQFLQTILDSEKIPDGNTLRGEIISRIKELSPKSTESPKFIDQKKISLPNILKIGRVDAESFELAMLEVYGQLQSGYPMPALIKQYNDIFSDYSHDEIEKEHGLLMLKREMARMFLKRWNKITAQWAGKILKEALISEISGGTSLTKMILSEAGLAMAGRQAKTRILRDLFEEATKIISTLNDDNDNNCQLRDRYYTGCALFCLYYVEKSKSNKLSINWDKCSEIIVDLNKIIEEASNNSPGIYSKIILQRLSQILVKSIGPNDFLPSYYHILDHTIRAARSNRHKHLLPSILLQIVRKNKLEIWKYKILNDTILDFSNSLNIVLEYYPELFNNNALKSIETFNYYSKELLQVLATTDDPEKICSVARIPASKIRNHFFNQQSSPVFECLSQTQLPLYNILLWVKNESVSRSIDFSFISDINVYKDFYIIARNESLVKELLRNFTFGAINCKDTDDIKKFNIGIKLETSRDCYNINRLKISIYTNFKSSNDFNSAVTSGPGLVELAIKDWSMFGISGDCLDDFNMPENHKYTGGVYITFPQGFQLPQ